MIKKFENFKDVDPYDEEIWEDDNKKILDNLLSLLIKRGWKISEEDHRYYKMSAPSDFGFLEDPPEEYAFKGRWKPYRLNIPKNVEKNDFIDNINKVIEILMDMYDDERDNYIK